MLAVLAAAVFTAGARAEPPAATPIRVVVEIAPKREGTAESSVMAVAWSATRRGQIEQSVAAKFASQLQERFRHWDFAPTHARVYATLRLRLIEFPGDPNRVLLQLQQYPRELEAQAIELWRMDWLQPGDVLASGLPVATRAADVIATALHRIDNAAQEQIIRDWLFPSVPIGAGGKLIEPLADSVANLRLVLALPNERFKALSASTLRISGLPLAATQPLLLPVTGISAAEPVEIAAGHEVLGLVVCPQAGAAWNALDVQRVRQLRIGPILIEKEVAAVDADFFAVPPP